MGWPKIILCSEMGQREPRIVRVFAEHCPLLVVWIRVLFPSINSSSIFSEGSDCFAFCLGLGALLCGNYDCSHAPFDVNKTWKYTSQGQNSQDLWKPNRVIGFLNIHSCRIPGRVQTQKLAEEWGRHITVT